MWGQQELNNLIVSRVARDKKYLGSLSNVKHRKPESVPFPREKDFKRDAHTWRGKLLVVGSHMTAKPIFEHAPAGEQRHLRTKHVYVIVSRRG